MSCRLSDIRWHIHHSLFDSQHHDGGDHEDTDTGQDPQGTGSDQLIGVLECSLKCTDGQECQVLLLLSIPCQIDIHKLLDLQKHKILTYFYAWLINSSILLWVKIKILGLNIGWWEFTSKFLETTFFTTAGNRSEASFPFATICNLSCKHQYTINVCISSFNMYNLQKKPETYQVKRLLKTILSEWHIQINHLFFKYTFYIICYSEMLSFLFNINKITPIILFIASSFRLSLFPSSMALRSSCLWIKNTDHY